MALHRLNLNQALNTPTFPQKPSGLSGRDAFIGRSVRSGLSQLLNKTLSSELRHFCK